MCVVLFCEAVGSISLADVARGPIIERRTVRMAYPLIHLFFSCSLSIYRALRLLLLYV